MRIISGKYRGKKIIAPQKLPVRPTTDMAKESLFNILNNMFYFDEVDVLDLFSGTGNISFEFASRGSAKVCSVDIDSGCTKFISRMAQEMKFENFEVIQEDVFKFLAKKSHSADIIFADPPYDMPKEDFEMIVKSVFENKTLNPGGILVIEHFEKMDLSNSEYYSNSRKYGSSVFSFFEEEEED